MRLPGLVSDALPDGWGLLLMDKIFLNHGRNLSLVSPLERLSFIGDRAMGALSFRPADALPLSGDDLDLLEMARAVQDVVSDRDTTALQKLALSTDSDIRKASAEALIDDMLDKASLLAHRLRHGAVRRATAKRIVSAVDQNLLRCARRR